MANTAHKMIISKRDNRVASIVETVDRYSHVGQEDFGMFTKAGNKAVKRIVKMGCAANLSWTIVEAMLNELSNDKRYEEAMDTAVREMAGDYFEQN